MESSKEIIMMIGSSIYSTFVKTHFKGIEFELQCGTSFKICEKINEFIKNKDKIHSYLVIDATNLSMKRREPIISLAISNNIPVKCFWFKSEISDCINKIKTKVNTEDFIFTPITFYNMSTQPSLDEGFSEIRVIDVI